MNNNDDNVTVNIKENTSENISNATNTSNTSNTSNVTNTQNKETIDIYLEDQSQLQNHIQNKTEIIDKFKMINIQKEIKKLELELKESEINSKKIFGIFKSPRSTRTDYEHDFDDIVYNDDSASDEELDEEDDDGNIIHKWSRSKKHRFQKCLWKLKYNRIISQFYLDRLRKREEKLSWWIIVISTITSGLTIANNVEEEPFELYNIIVNSSLTFSSMITSLIAAWIKKQKFVEKINEIDKYLIKINSLCEEIEVQFLLLEKDRIPYDDFKKQYIPKITQYVSSNPMIPPDEWKRCVKEITFKYPQLIEPDNNEENKLWPWFGDLIEIKDNDGNERFVRKPTKFMKYILKKDKKWKNRLRSNCCCYSSTCCKEDNHNSVYK